MEFKYYTDFEKLKKDYSRFLWYNFKKDKYLRTLLLLLLLFVILHTCNKLFFTFFPIIIESILYGLIITVCSLVLFSILLLYYEQLKINKQLKGLKSFVCSFKLNSKHIETDYDKNSIEWKDVKYNLVIDKTIYLVLKNKKDMLIFNIDGLIDVEFDRLNDFLRNKLNQG